MGKLDIGALNIVNYEQVQTRMNKALAFEESKVKRDRIGRFATKGEQKDGNNGRESRASKRADNSGNESRGQDGRRDSSASGSLRSLAKKTYKAQSDKQYSYHHIEGKGASDAFHKAIVASKEGNPFGAFVHAYESHEYEDQKKFISDGGEAGMTVKPDGDIVSVFNNPKIGTKKGVAGHMLEIALQNGGNRLDCFDGFLPKLYTKYGFVPVAKMKFSREYAPEGWNFERDGEPDVLFFAHNGDDLDTVRSTSYDMPDMSKVPEIDDYDLGSKLQTEYVQSRNGAITKSLSFAKSFIMGQG